MIAGPQAGSSQNSPNPAFNLNGPPPLPPEATRRPTLAQLAGPPSDNGIGLEGGGRNMQVMRGMASVQEGFRLLATGLPGIAPKLAEFLSSLEQGVPQALASGQQSEQPQQMQGGGGVMPPGGSGMPPPQMQQQQQMQ